MLCVRRRKLVVAGLAWKHPLRLLSAGSTASAPKAQSMGQTVVQLGRRRIEQRVYVPDRLIRAVPLLVIDAWRQHLVLLQLWAQRRRVQTGGRAGEGLGQG